MLVCIFVCDREQERLCLGVRVCVFGCACGCVWVFLGVWVWVWVGVKDTEFVSLQSVVSRTKKIVPIFFVRFIIFC